jgi:hypothetical protein
LLIEIEERLAAGESSSIVPVLLICTGLMSVSELPSLMRISPALLMLGCVCGLTGPLGVLITLLVPATVSISPPKAMETEPY